jgi:glycine/D-amino acid oxidase-like deaminating enzyme
MYTNTPDEHFLIDWHPSSQQRVLLASPCSGHGFKFCSVVGEIVSQLLVEGQTSHDISLFLLRKCRRLRRDA